MESSGTPPIIDAVADYEYIHPIGKPAVHRGRSQTPLQEPVFHPLDRTRAHFSSCRWFATGWGRSLLQLCVSPAPRCYPVITDVLHPLMAVQPLFSPRNENPKAPYRFLNTSWDGPSPRTQAGQRTSRVRFLSSRRVSNCHNHSITHHPNADPHDASSHEARNSSIHGAVGKSCPVALPPWLSVYTIPSSIML